MSYESRMDVETRIEFRPVPDKFLDKFPEGYKYNPLDELRVDKYMGIMDEQELYREDYVRAGGKVKQEVLNNAIKDREKLLALKSAMRALKLPDGSANLLAITTEEKRRAIEEQDLDKLIDIYDQDKDNDKANQDCYKAAYYYYKRKQAMDRIKHMTHEQLMVDYYDRKCQAKLDFVKKNQNEHKLPLV